MRRKVGRRWGKLQPPQHWGPSLWTAHCPRSAQLCLSREKNRRKKLISQRSMKQVRSVQRRCSGPASQHSCIDLRTYNNCTTTTRNQCQTTAMVWEYSQELYFIGLLHNDSLQTPSLLTADGRLSTGPAQDKAVCLHRGLRLLWLTDAARAVLITACICSGRGLLQTAIQFCNCLRDTYMASSFSQNKFLIVVRNIGGKCDIRSNWVLCVMFVHHVSNSAWPLLCKQ